MKETVYSGAQIYLLIKKLEEEEAELDRALDEIDSGTLPHRLLSEAYEKKQKELSEAKRAEYTA